MVYSLEVTTQKIESSSLIVANSKKVSISRFWNWKTTNNNGIKTLLSYSTTIWITLAHFTNTFTMSKDLNYGSNITANMLWALLKL